jgi:hypothetical protein
MCQYSKFEIIITQISYPKTAKKAVEPQTKRNLFLSASLKAASSTGGKVKIFFHVRILFKKLNSLEVITTNWHT